VTDANRPAHHDDSADHDMRQHLRETPCNDCKQAPIRGCIGGMFPSWRIEQVGGGEYRYAKRCAHNVPQIPVQQPTQQRTPRRRYTP
jgi:hypothetical protein